MQNEELLNAWLHLSTAINNERLVSDMPYNESLICNILYRNQKNNPEKELTATDLCQMTRMLKSQMNRTLTGMEEKGIIIRERSEKDKRRIYVRMAENQIEVYEQMHRKILALVDAIIEEAGEEQTDRIIQVFHYVAEIAEGVLV